MAAQVLSPSEAPFLPETLDGRAGQATAAPPTSRLAQWAGVHQLFLQHLFGSHRQLLQSWFTPRRYLLRKAPYLRGQDIPPRAARSPPGHPVSSGGALSCWSWLEDAMHYFWIYSVWIPFVAFLFGFQGKRQFHSFFSLTIGAVIGGVALLRCTFGSLEIVWRGVDCLLVRHYVAWTFELRLLHISGKLCLRLILKTWSVSDGPRCSARSRCLTHL